MSVIIAALFAIVVGLGFSFFGYRVFLVFLPIIGFFAGLWLGVEGMNLLFGAGFISLTVGLVIGVVLGLILAVMSYLFYFAGVIIIAAIIGFGLGSGLMQAIGFDAGFLAALVGVIFAAVVAGVTIYFNLQKYVVIILTSILGANAILLGILLLLGRVSLGDIQSAGNAIRPVLADSWFWALAWAVVAVIGIGFQIRSNRGYAFEKSLYVDDWG